MERLGARRSALCCIRALRAATDHLNCFATQSFLHFIEKGCLDFVRIYVDKGNSHSCDACGYPPWAVESEIRKQDLLFAARRLDAVHQGVLRILCAFKALVPVVILIAPHFDAALRTHKPFTVADSEEVRFGKGLDLDFMIAWIWEILLHDDHSAAYGLIRRHVVRGRGQD